LHYEDGSVEKFQSKNWVNKLEEEKFYNRVMQLLETEVVMKFDKRLGKAEEFYGEEESKS
jgi:hypothetical protein